MTSPVKNRIESIDIIRGIAMVIMALDHTRDYIHFDANVNDPLDLVTTTPILFFTRWITHFCAPIFIFLSGTSIYLQSLRKSKKELGIFLLKRGVWLILVEITIVAFAWTFNPYFNIIPIQVIWAIGISMVILGLLMLLNLQFKVILIFGLTLVAGHNLLDIPEAASTFQSNFLLDLLHHGVFVPYEFLPNHYALLVYPFPAWTGVMILGYCNGVFFGSNFSSVQRRKKLNQIGFGLILFFVVLRFSNFYGDPVDWTTQKKGLYSFFSFLNVAKYPPSFLYLCITLGPALLLLSFVESIKNYFTNMMVIFGRTAFIYYIIHIYLIHFIAAIFFFTRGHSFDEGLKAGGNFPFLFVTPGEGYSLGIVYLVWAGVVIGLYPVCKRYNEYKTNHKEKWWLSYF